MEKTGLILDLATVLDQSWETYQLAHSTSEMEQHNQLLQDTLTILQRIKTDKNISLALGAEELLLTQELVTYANSPEETNSIKAAIVQLHEARLALSVVKNPQVYHEATKTYPAKQKENGLPIDSVRALLKSHSTRLSNSMKSALSASEKNILRQRKENLGMVKEVYMDMQRQTLNLPAPEKKITP